MIMSKTCQTTMGGQHSCGQLPKVCLIDSFVVTPLNTKIWNSFEWRIELSSTLDGDAFECLVRVTNLSRSSVIWTDLLLIYLFIIDLFIHGLID